MEIIHLIIFPVLMTSIFTCDWTESERTCIKQGMLLKHIYIINNNVNNNTNDFDLETLKCKTKKFTKKYL